jgi:hypothetical protein
MDTRGLASTSSRSLPLRVRALDRAILSSCISRSIDSIGNQRRIELYRTYLKSLELWAIANSHRLWERKINTFVVFQRTLKVPKPLQECFSVEPAKFQYPSKELRFSEKENEISRFPVPLVSSHRHRSCRGSLGSH